MSRLLSANFVRLWRSKAFWLGMGFLVVDNAAICIDHYKNLGSETILDGYFFGYAMLNGICLSVFGGLFLGVEYSDGTIRNKLIAGHTRGAVYLANLLTVFAASLLMALEWIVLSCGAGIPLFGPLHSDWQIILLMLLESILVLAALSAVFTAVGMLWQNKALSAVICILLTFFLYYWGSNIDTGLKQEEFWNYCEVSLSEEGEYQTQEISERNPFYVGGRKREVYEFLYDVLPTCQGIQIANMFEEHPKHPERIALYALGVTVSVTAGGIWLFSRKDIK